MHRKPIWEGLLTIILLTGCIFNKKAPAPDYSTSIYISDGTSDSTSAAANTNAENRNTIVGTKHVSKQDSLLKVKYSGYLKLPAENITNIRLYKYIDQWLYTPYLWGGTTKKGIDCSAFIQNLLAAVYKLKIPRTSIQQFYTNNVEAFSARHSLSEGDLVFFKTIPNSSEVTHVGLYLDNNMFVNASSSKGVSFASLRDPYWSTKYVGAGRVILKKSQRINN